jgi:isocitrate/isopropylmalate dehydrogenase
VSTPQNTIGYGVGHVSAHQIAVIPGDEVITSARAVLDAAASKHGISLGYTEFDWSCQRYADVFQCRC